MRAVRIRGRFIAGSGATSAGSRTSSPATYATGPHSGASNASTLTELHLDDLAGREDPVGHEQHDAGLLGSGRTQALIPFSRLRMPSNPVSL